MARIELSNIGGGGTLSLTTTGTSGASTLAGSVLNIPVYQGQLTLTTTGTSGAATLSGDILNIPQYSGGSTPAGSTGEIQYNNAGAFGASANLAWDNTNVRLNIGAPSAPTATLNVRGGGTTSATATQILTNNSNLELFKVLDNGAWGFNGDGIVKGGGNTSLTNSFTVRNSDNNTIFTINNDYSSPMLDITGSTAPVLRLSQSTANRTLSLYTSGTTSAMQTGSAITDFRLLNSSGFGSFRANINALPTAGGNLFEVPLNAASYNPTSGSTQVTYLSIRPTINQTGTATGVSRGLYCNPILTSAADWRSIEWSNNTGYGIYGVGTANNYLAGNTVIGTTTPSARLHVRGANTTAGVGALLVEDGAATPATIYRIDNDGKVTYRATNTAAGTTGAQTINRPSGTVNFGIGDSALVVTNSLCTTSSIVFATVRTNDATAYIKNVVPAAGSFTINLGAAATAETSVGFFIIN